MIVNLQHKFIHISIPRTATTCVNNTLGNTTHPEPHLHHMGISEVKPLNNGIPIDITDFFKFTFVRNPFDRLVSLYCEFRKNRGHKYSGQIVYDKPLLSEFDTDSEIGSFKNFVNNLEKSPWINDLFFKPQFNYININNKNVMNFIGKFENLNEDWNKIKNKIGYPNSTLNIHHPLEPNGKLRGSHHKHYKEYYSKSEIKVVKRIYSKDLEYFNYEF